VTTISWPAAAESSNRDSRRNRRNVTVFMSDNVSDSYLESKQDFEVCDSTMDSAAVMALQP
jgi:hypothetical protein